MSNLFPKDNPTALAQYFGRIELNDNGEPTDRWQRSALTYIDAPWRMVAAWDEEVIIRRIRINRALVHSINKVFGKLTEIFPSQEEREAVGLHLFGGTYVYRPRRNGNRLSLHAYGAAIDLDPARNGLGVKHNPEKGMMDFRIVEAFKAEGWKWGGEFKNPDCMHFEATS